MSDPHGTSIVRFKANLVSELQERVPNVTYQSPVTAEQVTGNDGSGESVWWEDEWEHSFTVPVMKADGLWFDETAVITLVIQVLGSDTDADQEAIDTRAAQILGHVIAILADDPTVGVPDTENIVTFHGLPDRIEGVSGYRNDPDVRASALKFDIAIQARLKL